MYQQVSRVLEVDFLLIGRLRSASVRSSDSAKKILQILNLHFREILMNNIEAFEAEARKLLEEAITLLVNKRRDYGPNALKGGQHGIAIRLSDKQARLENLMGITDGSFKPREAIVGDEKIEDTVRDILNYSILFLMEGRKDK
jgi:hypothetical protein